MADHGVIGDVSATLTSVLTGALSTLLPAPTPIAQVHDLMDNPATDPPMLTVFLYELAEDPTAKNRPPRHTSPPAALQPNVRVTRAPLALTLRYLITPWSSDRLTDQQILGRAMQALHDNAILSGPALRGGLANTVESIKIGLNQLSLEERTRIWHAIQKPYRISASYDVRVVTIDSTVERMVTPVADRELEWAAP